MDDIYMSDADSIFSGTNDSGSTSAGYVSLRDCAFDSYSSCSTPFERGATLPAQSADLPLFIAQCPMYPALGKRGRDADVSPEDDRDDDRDRLDGPSQLVRASDRSESRPPSSCLPTSNLYSPSLPRKRARFVADSQPPSDTWAGQQNDDGEAPSWAPGFVVSRSPTPPPSSDFTNRNAPTDASFSDQANVYHLVRPPTPVTHRRLSKELQLATRPRAMTHAGFLGMPTDPDRDIFSSAGGLGTMERRNSSASAEESIRSGDADRGDDGADEMDDTATPRVQRVSYFGARFRNDYYVDEQETNSDSHPSPSQSLYSYLADVPRYQPQVPYAPLYNNFSLDQNLHRYDPSLFAPKPIPAHIPILDDEEFIPEPYSTPEAFSMHHNSQYSTDAARSTSSPAGLSTTTSGEESATTFSEASSPLPSTIEVEEVVMEETTWAGGEWFERTEYGDTYDYAKLIDRVQVDSNRRWRC